jgi:hypothetical protein
VESTFDASPPDELPDPELDPPDPELDPLELLEALDPELEPLAVPTPEDSSGESSPSAPSEPPPDPPLAQWTRNDATSTVPARIRVKDMLKESLSPQSGPAEFDAIPAVRTLDRRPWCR